MGAHLATSSATSARPFVDGDQVRITPSAVRQTSLRNLVAARHFHAGYTAVYNSLHENSCDSARARSFVLCPDALGEMGGTDGRRLPACYRTIERHVPAAHRHRREARPAIAAWYGPDQCPVCLVARCWPGICDRASGILFWPDLRGAA